MKHIIRAFAIGLATATALLTFTYYQTNDQSDTKTLTDQEAIKHLEDKDYHVLSKSSFEELKQETAKQTEEKSEKDSQEINETKKKEPKDTEEESYSLTIEPGMLSSSISKNLKEAGIIDDPAKFDVYLKDHEYSRSIQIGTYQIDQDMTYEEIAIQITGQ